MPERSYSSSAYRYGFNGKENDDETGTQDYGMRIYNLKICKFLSIDPLTNDYPELTPYQFASNTPISSIDLDGAEAKIVTYGIKESSEHNDDNYVKNCGTACAKKLGVNADGVKTGKSILSILKSKSSDSKQEISVWINYGHSWNRGLYLTNNNGFYRGPLNSTGDGSANFLDLLHQSSSGVIRFSKHSLFIFASCGTAGDGFGGYGDGKGAYSSNSFASSIGDFIGKNYKLPNKEFVDYYKVTSIGATDLTNLNADGTITTDGTFIKTEKLYKIERTIENYKVKNSWLGITWYENKTRFVDKTTLVQTKTTDLGDKINPSEIANNHDDQNVEIK